MNAVKEQTGVLLSKILTGEYDSLPHSSMCQVWNWKQKINFKFFC